MYMRELRRAHAHPHVDQLAQRRAGARGGAQLAHLVPARAGACACHAREGRTRRRMPTRGGAACSRRPPRIREALLVRLRAPLVRLGLLAAHRPVPAGALPGGGRHRAREAVVEPARAHRGERVVGGDGERLVRRPQQHAVEDAVVAGALGLPLLVVDGRPEGGGAADAALLDHPLAAVVGGLLRAGVEGRRRRLRRHRLVGAEEADDVGVPPAVLVAHLRRRAKARDSDPRRRRRDPREASRSRRHWQ